MLNIMLDLLDSFDTLEQYTPWPASTVSPSGQSSFPRQWPSSTLTLYKRKKDLFHSKYSLAGINVPSVRHRAEGFIAGAVLLSDALACKSVYMPW